MIMTWSRIVLGVFALSAALATGAAAQALRVGQPAPDIAGPRWINSAPLAMPALRGRVVAVEFWTYG
jgi:hypothetical protein